MYTKNLTVLLKTFSEEFGISEPETAELFAEFSNSIEVLNIKGEPVSMLFLIDAEYYFNGDTCRLKYIFGAVTRKEFRGKSYMKELITHCLEKAKNEDYCGVYLFPASENLRNYYKTLGFRDAFWSAKSEAAFKAEGSMDDAYNAINDNSVGVIVPCRKFMMFQQKHDNACFYLENQCLYLLRSSAQYAETAPLYDKAEIGDSLSHGMAILFDKNVNTDAYLMGIYD